MIFRSSTRARVAPCGRRSPSSWPSRMSGRRPRCSSPVSASAVRRADVRPTNWSGGRPVSRRPVSRRPVRSGCPDRQASGVRGLCIQAVRSVLDPAIHRRGRGRPRLAHQLRRIAVVGERLARRCPNRAWRGSDGPTLAVRRSHECRGQSWAAGDTAAWYAHRVRRRARRLAAKGTCPAPECRWSTEGAGAHRAPPAGASWAVVGVCRPSGWTGRWRPRCVVVELVLVRCRPALEGPSGSAGSRLRPRRGRGM
jgi:hypothetical protein